MPASRDISAVLKLNRSLKIGINGLISTNPARMFSDAKKIGAPVRNLLFNIFLSMGTAPMTLGKPST